METMNIECPGCGATMIVDTEKKKVECPYCKTILPFTDTDIRLSQIESQERIRLKELEFEHQRKEHNSHRSLLVVILGIVAVMVVAAAIFLIQTAGSAFSRDGIPLAIPNTEGLIGEGQIAQITGTVYGEEEFEAALNRGENMEGTFVKFTVLDIKPNSTFGYDLWAGEHLNFVSSKNPDVNVGDVLTVKATSINAFSGSWIIYYQKTEGHTQ